MKLNRIACLAPSMIIFGTVNESRALVQAVGVALLATMLILFSRQCLQPVRIRRSK